MADTITITCDGQRVCTSRLPQDVIDRLTVETWEPTAARFGVRAALRHRAILRSGLGAYGVGKALVGAAGLEDLIARLAERAGLSYVHRTVKRAELPHANLGALAGRGAVDVAVLQAILRHNRLQVRLGRGVDPAKLAVYVVLAFSTADITIAAATIKEARHVARVLRAAGIQASVLTGKDLFLEGARVIVGTYEQLGQVAARLYDLDLLIVLDGVAALGEVPRSYLTPMFMPVIQRVPRVVGLVRADRHLPLADRIGLVELFGPEWITIPAHGWIERPVEVVPVRFKGGQACWNPHAVTRKRFNLWGDSRRNRLIARGARSLVTGDRAGSLAAFPRLDDVPGLRLPARVLAVVEGLEHAEALKTELRDWPIDEPAAGWVAHEIATFDHLRSRPLDDIDVLVRADGGSGLLPIAPFALARPSSAPGRALVVVDILDRNHPELRKAVRSRANAYAEAGWRPTGWDAVDLALLTLFPKRARR